ncbi:MAG TPA: hypothetical protein VFG29_14830 [Syntrophales bacterium]|nr:hypothetical protein [Syntrophales bacterium]
MPHYERVKPLDAIFNDKATEFESGRDRYRDRELDEMIWEFGDYENEEPLMEIIEFEPEVPIEEELAEKKRMPARAKVPFKNVKKKARRRRTASAAAAR